MLLLTRAAAQVQQQHSLLICAENLLICLHSYHWVLLLLQIEEEAVLLLTGLLKLAEAPARAQLQRVLLNLCAHPETRNQIMQILMSMLRAPLSAEEAAEASQVCTSLQSSSSCFLSLLLGVWFTSAFLPAWLVLRVISRAANVQMMSDAAKS